MSLDAATAERALRLSLWDQIKALGWQGLKPQQVRDFAIYGGAQGIWVDKARTVSLGPDGVTVGVLHTGSSYADDLYEGGIVYHYPRTSRPAIRDAGEVNATKAARTQDLPIFVVTKPSPSSSKRDVRLAWVEDWDDTASVFEITFGETPPPPGCSDPPADDAPFELEAGADAKKSVVQTVREGQHRFKFQVLRRYEGRCVVCALAVSELLDAAHVRGRQEGGSNDERNGVLLCATHHRAFDRGLIGIEPSSLSLLPTPDGPTLKDMRVTYTSLGHLPHPPHPAALEWRWKWWQRKMKKP